MEDIPITKLLKKIITLGRQKVISKQKNVKIKLLPY
jgi:hypothetical protein